MRSLNNVRVAIVSENGFEESELFSPKAALEEAGAIVDVISPHLKSIRGWNHGEWGKEIKVDKDIGDVSASEYDALLLPGGVMNPDKLRMSEEAVDFASTF